MILESSMNSAQPEIQARLGARSMSMHKQTLFKKRLNTKVMPLIPTAWWAQASGWKGKLAGLPALQQCWAMAPNPTLSNAGTAPS